MRLLALLLFAAAGLTWGQPAQLTSFDELLSTLTEGEDAKAVIHYAKCRLVIDSTEYESPDAIGGMDISTYEYFAPMSIRNPRGFLSASETVLIGHPHYGHVYNYAKLRIYEDGEVEITVRYLDAVTYEIKMDETFYSVINDGENDSGVYLYKK